jgi:hypothetical protein
MYCVIKIKRKNNKHKGGGYIQKITDNLFSKFIIIFNKGKIVFFFNVKYSFAIVYKNNIKILI